ncbi:hypothetical protein GCM10022244_12650 [Streptomyces gulbargensis]|uniref:Uncharacterized protein n=1 Tax=Streptomyces gulbargensis TaxID=364901 RepID=A0ABP7LKX7_9ACTN
MNPPVTDDALCTSITQHLDQLTARLRRADAQQAAQILARAVDMERGILSKVHDLVSAGSRASRNHAADGSFPAEAWLALGRAANTLANLTIDLEQHQEVFEKIGKQPPAPASAPPKATAFVARGRHR